MECNTQKGGKMKRMIMAAMVIGGVAMAQDPIKVEIAPDASGAMLGVDLLAGKDAEGRREQSWWQAIKSGAWDNKWIILGTAATAITVDRVAENNDWLWYEGPDKDKIVVKEIKEAPLPKPAPASTSQAAGGNASQTTINATDNSTVNITITETGL